MIALTLLHNPTRWMVRQLAMGRDDILVYLGIFMVAFSLSDI